MHKSERSVFFFDAHSDVWHRQYEGLPRFPHYSLAKAIRDMHSSDDAEYGNSRGDIYIEDMVVGQDRCEMLIGFSNKEAANPTLNNRAVRKRRVIMKNSGEGVETSAHILWRYGGPNNADDCAFFLESATGLASTTIVRFLNRLLRIHAKLKNSFTVSDPTGVLNANGTFKQIAVRPHIALIGHPSTELIKDLQQGELTELELYTNNRKLEPWDSNAQIVYDKEAVVLRPNPNKVVGKAMAAINRAFSIKTDYELARINFKTETGVNRSVRVFSDGLKLVDDNGYVRKEILTDIGDDLPAAFDKLHTPLMNKMKQLK